MQKSINIIIQFIDKVQIKFVMIQTYFIQSVRSFLRKTFHSKKLLIKQTNYMIYMTTFDKNKSVISFNAKNLANAIPLHGEVKVQFIMRQIPYHLFSMKICFKLLKSKIAEKCLIRLYKYRRSHRFCHSKKKIITHLNQINWIFGAPRQYLRKYGRFTCRIFVH